MTANFNDAAINGVLDRVVSYCLATGRFSAVNQHEPKSAPASPLGCAVWVQSIGPVRSSGQAATTGLLLLDVRIYQPFLTEPYDYIDPNVLAAVTDLMGAFSGDFDFDQNWNVRCVDLLGMSGQVLSAQAGYVEISKGMYRVMTINLPIIINDMFAQAT